MVRRVGKYAVATGLASMLLSAGVQAQGSVTLFGIADVGVAYTSKTLNLATGGNGGHAFQMLDSGMGVTQFGIKGIEDLGGGMKVKFELASAFNLGNGGVGISNGNTFGNQAWLALAGNFGEVKAGLQFSPFFTTLVALDPRQTIYASGGMPMADAVGATGIFNSNAISYTSPEIAGLRGSMMVALGGEAGNFQAGRQYSASLSYRAGGLLVGGAYYNGNSGGTVVTKIPSTVAFIGKIVGASYSYKNLTMNATFENYHVAGSFNNYVYGGGFNYLIFPDLEINGGAWWTADQNNSKNHSVLAALGGEYFLSKRTSWYAQVGRVDNHGAMNTGLCLCSLNTLYGAQGQTIGVNVGINHKF
ncbi:porin [Paraburkholderia sp. J76]|uniref:porin n=1 Tax=Paraburkholderia sp. J76 TaxID=2805439 RepID=UPI002ABE271C|nr:porin [Paraburkholderia sp. J76]